MNYERVTSSNIAAIAYDDSSSTLGVKFNSGSEYHYFSVPRSVFDAFRRAPSKGQFFDTEVKKKPYRYQQIS